LENRYWTFGGSTIVNTNKYIRLTPDRQSKQGWLWSREKLESENWRIEFEFRVDGAGTRVYGDGMAFWFTEEKEVRGPAFGNQDTFKGLGIFFDTYMNGKHSEYFPYVGIQVSDGSKPYTVDDDDFGNLLGGCQARFRKVTHATRARITYFARALKLELDILGNNHWTLCYSQPGVNLPKAGYIGFTAATGDVADEHDILSVNTDIYVLPNRPKPQGILEAAIPFDIPAEVLERDRIQREKLKHASSAWEALLWTFVVVAVIIGIVVVVVFSRSVMEKNSKRF